MFDRIHTIMHREGERIGFFAAIRIAMDLELPSHRRPGHIADLALLRLRGQYFDWTQENKTEPVPTQLAEVAALLNKEFAVALDSSSAAGFVSSLLQQVRIIPRTFIVEESAPRLSLASVLPERVHLPRVLIVGMKEKYQPIVQREFNNTVDLTFLYAEGGGRIDRKRLRSLATSADKVIVMPWIDHSTTEFLQSVLPPTHRPVILGVRGVNTLINYIVSYLHSQSNNSKATGS